MEYKNKIVASVWERVPDVEWSLAEGSEIETIMELSNELQEEFAKHLTPEASEIYQAILELDSMCREACPDLD